jgi:methionyl-tRNA formyltransferase
MDRAPSPVMKAVVLANWGIGAKLISSLCEHPKVSVEAVISQYEPSSEDIWFSHAYQKAKLLGSTVHRQEDRLLEQIGRILKDLAPDIFIMHACPKILPEGVFNLPLLGSVNLHPSYLPHYRGRHPTQQVLRDKVDYTGLTFHVVDKGIDTGPILVQEKIPIEESDTVVSVIEKMKVVVPRLTEQLVTSLSNKAPRGGLCRRGEI